MNVDVFGLGPLQTNCFLLSKKGQAVAVDPGGDPAPVLRHLADHNLKLTHILSTHFHFDHIGGNAALAQATGATILGSKVDAPLLATGIGSGEIFGMRIDTGFDFEPISEGEIELLGETCKILETPGHSQGSLSFYFPDQGHVFSGDLIFERSIGRTDFDGGDMEQLLDSVRKKIFTLDDATVIHSGHGSDTTVGEEKRHNPFFSSFAP